MSMQLLCLTSGYTKSCTTTCFIDLLLKPQKPCQTTHVADPRTLLGTYTLLCCQATGDGRDMPRVTIFGM